MEFQTFFADLKRKYVRTARIFKYIGNIGKGKHF
jgi:hypothetical protein